jgi:hypothetical protein
VDELYTNLATLPALPFSIYFLDSMGNVSPKRIYTVTETIGNVDGGNLLLYILELDVFAVWIESSIVPVTAFSVNEPSLIYVKRAI